MYSDCPLLRQKTQNFTFLYRSLFCAALHLCTRNLKRSSELNKQGDLLAGGVPPTKLSEGADEVSMKVVHTFKGENGAANGLSLESSFFSGESDSELVSEKIGEGGDFILWITVARPK